MEFAEIMLQWLEDWPDLLQNILQSDKAVFHVSGFVIRDNAHYWAESCDGDMTIEKTQGCPKLQCSVALLLCSSWGHIFYKTLWIKFTTGTC
jgi:hypothetical protein